MEKLKEAMEQANIKNIDETLKKFQKYMEYIFEWNKKVNLTAIKNEKDFIEKHYIDSIAIAPSKEFKGSTDVIDIGTGGGFPGMPLAFIAPEKKFVLVDSLKKRLNIIGEFCRRNKIENVSLVHGRAEDLGHNKEHREAYDLVVSRAVATMPVLAEYCLPFPRIGGNFVAYKGPEIDNEFKKGEKAIEILGGEYSRIEQSEGLGNETKHNLVYVKKKKTTPGLYPRKAGTPSKQPL